MNLLFFDTETTGVDDNARIIQIAFKTSSLLPTCEFYGIPDGAQIEIEAMATHHITPDKIDGLVEFENSDMVGILNDFMDDHVFIAHNAKFDIGKITNWGCDRPKWIIDTLKVARFLFDQETYKLQYLRYQFGIYGDEIAHDALGDVLVLEKVFEHLLSEMIKVRGINEREAIAEMINISLKPSLIRRFAFGKHRGKLIEECPSSYLNWMIENMKEMDEDLRYSVDIALSNKKNA